MEESRMIMKESEEESIALRARGNGEFKTGKSKKFAEASKDNINRKSGISNYCKTLELIIKSSTLYFEK